MPTKTSHFQKNVQKNVQKKVLVLGAGNFGTCLANHLAIEGHDVSLWARSREVVESINKERKNPKYLSTITLAPTLRAINTLDASTFNDLHALIVAVPMQAMRNVLTPIAQHLGRVSQNAKRVC